MLMYFALLINLFICIPRLSLDCFHVGQLWASFFYYKKFTAKRCALTVWQLAPKLFRHMKAFSSNTFYLYWNLVAMWCWNIRGRERRQFLLIFFFDFCDVLAIWEPGTDYKGTESANSSWEIFLTCHFWCRFLHCQRSNHFYCLNAWSKLVWINICIP